MKKTNLKKIKCPHCGAENIWTSENPFRPFCSERCKSVDFADWATESHRIPGEPAEEAPKENNDES